MARRNTVTDTTERSNKFLRDFEVKYLTIAKNEDEKLLQRDEQLEEQKNDIENNIDKLKTELEKELQQIEILKKKKINDNKQKMQAMTKKEEELSTKLKKLDQDIEQYESSREKFDAIMRRKADFYRAAQKARRAGNDIHQTLESCESLKDFDKLFEKIKNPENITMRNQLVSQSRHERRDDMKKSLMDTIDYDDSEDSASYKGSESSSLSECSEISNDGAEGDACLEDLNSISPEKMVIIKKNLGRLFDKYINNKATIRIDQLDDLTKELKELIDNSSGKAENLYKNILQSVMKARKNSK